MVIFLVVITIGITYAYASYKISQPKKVQYSEVLAFVRKANSSYIKSYLEENITYFEKYAEEQVVTDLEDQITYGPKILFGVERYRECSMKVIDENKSYVIVSVTIRHKHLKLNNSISISVGDDIDSIWRVRKGYNGYRVADILY